MLVYFVVALHCEAAPIINFYNLKSVHNSNPQIYRNESMCLVVTGIGGLACATGVGYLSGLLGTQKLGVWLNIGIAGHQYLPRGSACLVRKVTDRATNKTLFPSLPFSSKLYKSDCFYVDRAEIGFSENGLFEMESFAFFKAAWKFAALDFVHSAKIVSDNKVEQLDQINHLVISALVKSKLELLHQQLIQPLITIVTSLKDELTMVDETAYLHRWHFSQTNRLRLARNLREYALLHKGEVADIDAFEHCKKASHFLDEIELIIQRSKIRLS